MTFLVIPVADKVKDSADLLEGLLVSIFGEQRLDQSFGVIVCFDNCQRRFIEHFLLKYPGILPVINSGNNLNFAGNANLGLRVAHQQHKDSAIVVNQDCVLPATFWMEKINGRGGLCVPNPVNVCPEPPITSMVNSPLNEGQPKEIIYTPQLKLIGFCIYMSKEGMDKVGYWDGAYLPRTFNDDDLCARYLLAGLPVEHVNVNVNHYTSRCGAYNENDLGLDLIKYRTKWSIPVGIPHAEINKWIVDHHVWKDEMKEE